MRAVWLLVKWVLIPAALAVIGYTIVGPRIGKVDLTFPTEVKRAQTQAVPVDTDAGTAKPSPYPAPDVDVKVSQATSERLRRRHRVRRRENKPVETPTVPVAPPDSGGSGGATTTGGDPAVDPGIGPRSGG